MNAIVPIEKRRAVWKRDFYRCHYCDELIDDIGATVDHMTPRSLGGTNDMENLVTCCRWCNTAKADVPYALFLAIIDEIGPNWKRNTTFKKVLDLYRDGLVYPQRQEWSAVLCGCFRISETIENISN